ncbi:MAG: pilus assembly protein PilC, type pilus assembly protein PilC [Candidatus Taylorbacteria bacterium]|nr:pilus assembly protein PilC, type pilus assembly protein PilC [Candidatus Taylorbacteria bacterium]
MAHFTYKARKRDGDVYTGEQEAEDRYEIYKSIKNSGDELISIDERGSRNPLNFSFSLPFLASINTHEKIIFARNLGSMIEAGLAVSRALTVMERQTKKKELKKILSTLNNQISEGKTLSDALAGYPKVFTPLFISMVRSGEQSGTLAGSLKLVALQMDRAYALQRRVRGAMMYPAIILFAMILIATLMLTYIVPTLMKTFTELKLDLPFATRLVLGASDLMRHHGFSVFIGLIIAAAAFYFWSKKDQGKYVIHYAILKIPTVGGIVKEVNAARTARTLSSLLTSGVDVVDAVSITRDVIQNVHYKKVLDTAGEVIKKGSQMSKVFTDNSKLYPIFLGEMIAVGEETGKIGEMLLNVAAYYEEDVEERTKDISAIIEPFLMIFIGAGVGFFALAMISPMYSLVNVI